MQFVRPLERAREANATTRAILVLPRTHMYAMKEIVTGNRWRRIQYWHKAAKQLFCRPAADSILGWDRRTLS